MTVAPMARAMGRTIMMASLLVDPDWRSRPLDDASAVRARKYDGLRHPDKETVLDDPRYTRQPLGQAPGIGDAVERGVQYPVAAIRDESVAVPALAQPGGPGTAGGGHAF